MTAEARTIDPDKLRRLEQATDWLLRLQEPTRTEADLNEWLRWCDADPENFVAFETAQARWQDLDALKADAATAASETQIEVPRASVRSRNWKRALAIAAGFAAMAVAPLILHELATTETAPQSVAATHTNRAATLPDGSKVILGAQSVVNMDFNGPKRQLELSAGDAYFKVKHDAERPFVVHAGEVSVTAIGTAFDVRRRHDKVTVTVEEGIVEVRGASLSRLAAPVWRAEAGYQLTYSPGSRTASIASVSPAAALTWRSGELAYLHEPLGSVVEDLNRYSTRQIVIADPRLAELPFTGTAWANSLDGWLAGIQQAYPIEVTQSAAGDIVLRTRR